MPSQLELINGKKLLEMLEELAKKSLEGGFGRTKNCGAASRRSAAPADTSTERRELAAIFASRRISAGSLHECCARDL